MIHSLHDYLTSVLKRKRHDRPNEDAGATCGEKVEEGTSLSNIITSVRLSELGLSLPTQLLETSLGL